MLELRSMTQGEFDEYRPRTVASLAAELVKAHGSKLEEARRVAERSIESFIPRGRLPAPDQYLYTIVKERESVGVVCFGIRSDRSVPEAFVWDLWVEPEWRKRGIAAMAMAKLEALVKELGISCLALNVFAHNRTATHLYEQLGYVPVSTHMVKRL